MSDTWWGRGADDHQVSTLPDTDAVAAFMDAFEQTVRTTPTADIPEDERRLRVALVVEEALEFAAAMGCTVRTPDPDGLIPVKGTIVEIDPNAEGIDLVEATDALADIIVVTKGSALTLGVPVDRAFQIVHGTNMAKLGPDGKIIRRPEDGKVLKPAGWVPPTDAIRALLDDASVAVEPYTGRPRFEN